MTSVHSELLCNVCICMVFGAVSPFLVSVLGFTVIFKVKGRFQGHNNWKMDWKLVISVFWKKFGKSELKIETEYT